MDNNQKYDVVRRAVICLFSSCEKYGLDIKDFAPVMKFVSDCYVNSVRYKEACASGRIKDIC